MVERLSLIPIYFFFFNTYETKKELSNLSAVYRLFVSRIPESTKTKPLYPYNDTKGYGQPNEQPNRGESMVFHAKPQ